MSTTSLKCLFLKLSKYLGLFCLSRYLTRGELRILCYHGFSLDDEYLFRPKLFMKPATFKNRMMLIRRHGYPVLDLDDALERLKQGRLPACAVVITVDDGFFSSNSACRLLQELSFPATIYVTSYYVTKESPVFRLLIQYLFWKSQKTAIRLADVSQELKRDYSLTNPEEKNKAIWELIDYGERLDSEEERATVSVRLASLLAVDLGSIKTNRSLSLLTCDEIKALRKSGTGIQLHTHRHRELYDSTYLGEEISDNRAVLEPLVGKLEHLCYPSGVWSNELWPSLKENGIKSAVTCEAGLNRSETPLFRLKRFLDSENIGDIEFEAELAGYTDLLRNLKNACKRTIARVSG